MYIRNKIGLEAEFLLRDKKGELVIPQYHQGFDHDDFELLGEFRAEAGFTRHEAAGNFFTSLFKVLDNADKHDLTVDFSGVTTITPAMKSKVLRGMGVKEIAVANNAYNTDLLAFSDDVVDKKGKIVASRVSAGLHVHFSRRMYNVSTVKGKSVTEDVNLLTSSQIKGIVRQLDKNIFPQYKPKENLKYRQAGFYEMKPWGFEYRSLPMTADFLDYDNIRALVDYSFSLLEKLEK